MTRTLTLIISLITLLGNNAAAQDILVPAGATWSYLDDGSDQGTAWRASGFDDSAWATGPSEFGYGDTQATLVSFGPDPDAKFVTTYFRHAFNITDASVYLTMTLRLQRDDGAAVFLNGTQLLQTNLPAGFAFDSLALNPIEGSLQDVLFPIPLPPTLLVTGTNVIAVEMHQVTAISPDLSFNLALEAFDDLDLVREPYLQRGSSTGITLRWRTNVASDSRVAFGSAPGALTQVADSSTMTTEHVVTLRGLTPNTRYYYSVGTTTRVLSTGSDHTFKTFPAPGTDVPIRVWAIGDGGTANEDARAVRDSFSTFTGNEAPSLWLMLGDNAYNAGLDFEYQAAVFDTYTDLLKRSVLFPTRGNHEESANTYFGIFDMPTAGEAGGFPSGSEAYYSFDCANVHFICLDSDTSSRDVGQPMWQWAEADLMATDQDWIVAFWHHPPYTKGSHDSDTELRLVEMRENFLPLLEDHGVDLVLCGHSHTYERSYLIDGHYDVSNTFDMATMRLDPGDGSKSGDGHYETAVGGHTGTVYAVSGSAGKVTGGPLDHPAMVFGVAELGSLVLDFGGNRMDVSFLDASGVVLDEFTVVSHPDEGLTADTTAVVYTGGTQTFSLDAGAAYAGEPYFLIGGHSGTQPGVAIGAGLTIPLNQDSYTSYTLQNANTAVLVNTLGTLDAAGQATAALSLGLGVPAALVGLTIHHSFFVFDTSSPALASFVSNPYPLVFLP